MKNTGLKQVTSRDEKTGNLSRVGFTNVTEAFRTNLEIEKHFLAFPGQETGGGSFRNGPCATFAQDKCWYNSPCLANRLYHAAVFLGRVGPWWAVTLNMICEVFNLSQLQNVASRWSKSMWSVETIHFAKVNSYCLIHREHVKGFSEIYSAENDSGDKSETMVVQKWFHQRSFGLFSVVVESCFGKRGLFVM